MKHYRLPPDVPSPRHEDDDYESDDGAPARGVWNGLIAMAVLALLLYGGYRAVTWAMDRVVVGEVSVERVMARQDADLRRFLAQHACKGSAEPYRPNIRYRAVCAQRA